MSYVLGYGAHCFELYGIRTWIVAFWTFVAARHSEPAWLGPATVSVVFSLLAMPARGERDEHNQHRSMKFSVEVVILPVRDVDRAVRFYVAL